MIQDFFSIIYPDLCIGCDEVLIKGENTICTTCRINLPETNYHLSTENPVAQRFYGKILLKNAFSYLHFVKGGIVQNMLHHLKYKNNQEIGYLLGLMYGNELFKNGFSDEFEIILPVPLHKNKLKKRGYNQCDSIAQGLSDGLKIKWSNTTVQRVSANTSQTKKNRIERWENVESIFKITQLENIQNKNVLLIDDVVTTGSTLESCGHTIINANCKSLSICTIACAL